MIPIRRKAAAAGKAGRGPVSLPVFHGPNRHLVGTQEQSVHGDHTLAGVGIPFVERHRKDVRPREAFRQHSQFSGQAVGAVVAPGSCGYEYALVLAVERLGG